MSKHSEAVRRWRQAHPEQAREVARNNARKRRRRLGIPVRGNTGSYVVNRRKKRRAAYDALWRMDVRIVEYEMKLITLRRNREKLAVIYERAKQSKMKAAA